MSTSVPASLSTSPPKPGKSRSKSKNEKGLKEELTGEGKGAGEKEKACPPVDEIVAHRAMKHFIAGQLYTAGFTSASAPLLDEIERTMTMFVTQIHAAAREYAHVSYRTDPNAYDVMAACREYGVDVHKLWKAAARRKKRKTSAKSILALLPPASIPPQPSFLPSDSSGDEKFGDDPSPLGGKKKAKISLKSKEKELHKADNDKDGGTGAKDSAKKAAKKEAMIPPTLRELPKHFPALPPKHTYLRTAPPKATKRTLASLETRYETTLLIQDSLRSLIQGTDDTVPESTVPPTHLVPVLSSFSSFGNGVGTPVAAASYALPALPNGHPMPISQSGLGVSSGAGSGAGSPAPDAGKDNRVGVAPLPPTLEELGMGGLVNYEMVDRTANGTRRRRWRV